MCGLSGFFSNSPVDKAGEAPRLEKMRAVLAHRGPDGSGVEVFDHAALVHNRLAIIDLSGGSQPLFGAQGKTCVVFNGEIYNYQELRNLLKDYPFRTQSDTEALVALYEAEGVEGWRRLRGMYAFAFWDDLQGRGYLVRDPIGIKPLFYAEADGKLLFASEAKAILAYTGQARLNPAALHNVLNFRYVVGDTCLFQGIRQLPPGEMLVWECQRQLSFSSIAPETGKPLADLNSIFPAAIERHLVADVSMGCFLSGGVDSALVARLAAERGPLASYTLEVGDDPREADYARDTAERFGLPNFRQAFAIDDPLTLHRQLIWHLETPKVNALQGAILAEFAARDVKVALSGLGGDELFFGYNAHKLMWLAQATQTLLPFGMNRGLFAVARKALPHLDVLWTERERGLAMLGALPDWSRVYGLLRNVWDAPALRRELYGERMLDERPPDSFEWLAGNFPRSGDAVATMAAFEFKNKLVNDLLWQEDRVGMRVGLEIRVPFLDWDVVQWALAHSRRELMPWGRGKHRLKRYAATLLPLQILHRPKSGFQLDIVDAARGVLKPVFDEYLSEARLRQHRLFNPRFVQAIRRLPARRGLRWHYFLLYLMAQSHIFLEEFCVN